ncbi:MAG: hypothetical protein ACM3RP_02905 [Chitinophagales bacterium]
MKETAVAAACLAGLVALLSWRCVAAGPLGQAPDVPLPVGCRIVRTLEPIVNLQPVRLVIATTSLSPAEVADYFRGTMPALGWEEQPAHTDGKPGPLSFTRPGHRCWVLAIREADKPETILMTEVRSTSPPRQPALLARQLVANRLDGVPLYPGVQAALIVENGVPSGPVTVLYEAAASLERLASYYAKACPDLKSTLAAANAATKWVSATGRFRGLPLAIHLYRQADGKTAVLILRGDLQARRGGERACSGAATS